MYTISTPEYSPLLDTAARFLRSATIQERKAVILLCRAQYVPSPCDTFLFRQVFPARSNNRPSLFEEFCHSTRALIESPLMSGLLLDLARGLPFSRENVAEMREASWSKEMSTNEAVPRPSVINYRPFFYSSASHEQIHPDIEANPGISHFVSGIVDDWLRHLQEEVLYPRMSYKRSSRDAQRDYEDRFGPWHPTSDEDMFSQVTMERVYSRTGIQIGGVCEMRQKWYRSGLSPRTYYAQGGLTYHSSKYLQDAFTDLVDRLPITNHFLRLSPTRLNVDEPGSYVFIYDLTSFTSNLHEHRAFMYALAERCRGTHVTLFDSRDGPLTCDLGNLLDRYNDFCMEHPPYSRERRDRRIGMSEWIVYHHVASFLGVFGNLMTATFLHGVVVLFTVGHVDRAYTAGDDGGAVVKARIVVDKKGRVANPPTDDVMKLFFAILLLGVIEWSKVFVTFQPGAVALKRPLVQLERRLLQRFTVIWPGVVLHAALDKTDWPDPRYPEMELETRAEIRSALLSSVQSFLTQISVHYDALSEIELASALEYVRYCYDRYHFPKDGWVPQIDGSWKDLCPVCPDYIEDLNLDPVSWVIRRRYRGHALVPIRVSEEEEMDFERSYGLGDEFSSCSSRWLSHMTKLGYLDREPLFTGVSGEDGLQALLNEYLAVGRRLYRYTVVRVIPLTLLVE